MVFKRIFALEGKCDAVWCVCDAEGLDVFSVLLDQWRDVQFLIDFLKKFDEQLLYDFFGMSYDDAITVILDQLDKFEDELYNVLLGDDPLELIFKIFEPLHESVTSISTKEDHFVKAKPYVKKPIVRFYGIRLKDGTVIITGGGLKLTRRMSDDRLLQLELEKVRRVNEFLKSENITDIDSLVDYSDS